MKWPTRWCVVLVEMWDRLWCVPADANPPPPPPPLHPPPPDSNSTSQPATGFCNLTRYHRRGQFFRPPNFCQTIFSPTTYTSERSLRCAGRFEVSLLGSPGPPPPPLPRLDPSGLPQPSWRRALQQEGAHDAVEVISCPTKIQ